LSDPSYQICCMHSTTHTSKRVYDAPHRGSHRRLDFGPSDRADMARSRPAITCRARGPRTNPRIIHGSCKARLTRSCEETKRAPQPHPRPRPFVLPLPRERRRLLRLLLDAPPPPLRPRTHHRRAPWRCQEERPLARPLPLLLFLPEAATNSRILFSLVHLLPQKTAASSERAGQEDPERSGGSLCT
jgi:hypothetical protein